MGQLEFASDFTFVYNCFISVYNDGAFTDDLNIRVSFANNSALNGGNVLFGGNIDQIRL